MNGVFGCRRSVGVVVVMASMLAAPEWIQAQSSPSNPKPPYDVLVERQKHYDTLDRARDQALRDYPLRYDADGNVIKDAAYDAAIADYNRQKQASTERVRSDRRRDDELDRIRREAGISTDPKLDSGTPPHDPKYGGAFSDRDLTVESTQHLNAMVDSAKARGYTVEHGGDYIRIKELDVVVWNPDRVQIRRTPDGEVIVSSTQADRLHDPEFVAVPKPTTDAGGNVQKRDPGVSQQIKKSEADLSRSVPHDTRSQAEMVTNLGKAGHKSVKSVDKDGTAGVVSADQRRKLEEIKGRQATVDDIADPFDKPATRRRKIEQFQSEVGTVLSDSLRHERKQRFEETSRLKRETTDLHRQLGSTTDAGERTRLKNEIDARLRQSESLHQQQQADDLALRVVEKKNPRVRDKVIHPDHSEVDLPNVHANGKLTPLKAYGLSLIAKGMGIYQAYETESSDSARDDRKFSQANMAVNMLTNMTGISQVIGSVEGFEYETGAGLQEYVKSEADRYRAEGYDVENNPGLQEVIRRRAILRATGRATWQAVKSVPFVGDIVSAVEDTYNLSESVTGLGYDLWKSRQIEQVNHIAQRGQQEQVIALAEGMLDALRKQIAAVNEDVRAADDVSAAQAKYASYVEATESRIHDLLVRIEAAKSLADAAPSPVAANTLAEIDPYLQSVVKLAQGFVRDADELLKQVADGDVTREDLVERTGGLTRRMQAIDVDYFNASERLDTARRESQRLAAAGDLTALRQSLATELQTAKAAAQAFDDLAQRMESIDKRYTDATRCFDDQKERLRSYCHGGIYDNASDSSKEMLRFLYRQSQTIRLPTLAMDAHVVRARDLRLQRDRLRMLVEQVRGSVESTGENALLPIPADEGAEAWTRVLASAEKMDQAVGEARDRMRRLRQMAANEPPIFNLVAKSLGPSAFQFDLAAANLPEGKKYLYAWNFGEGPTEASTDLIRKHQYAQPGRYEVIVGVFEETPQASLKLGEATVTLNIGSGDTTPLVPVTSPGTIPTDLFVALTAELSLDYDRQGNGALKDRIGMPHYLEFAIYPDSGRVKIRLSEMRRGLYFEKSGIYEPFYHLDIQAIEAEGLLDPRSNRIELPLPQVSWKQDVGVWSLGGGVTQNKYTPADGHRRAGLDPTGVRWSGVVSGELDWRSGRTGATSGRLEVNPLVSGDWKIAAGDWLGIGGAVEQLRLPGKPPSQIRFVRLHPDVESAKRSLPNIAANPQQSFAHNPEHDVLRNGPLTYVRIGHWTACWMRYDPRPADHQLQYELLVKFIDGPGLRFEQVLSEVTRR